jgi:hypothetical protein
MEDTSETAGSGSAEFEYEHSENVLGATAETATGEDEDVVNFEDEIDDVDADIDADVDDDEGDAEDDAEGEGEGEGVEVDTQDTTGEVQLSEELGHDEVLDATVQRVKRPSSSWMIYMNKNRQRLKEEQPTLTIGEVAKSLSAEYRGLSNDLLEVYVDLARKDKERYTDAMTKMRNSGQVEAGGGSSYAPLRAGETILPLVSNSASTKINYDSNF